jgi:hypothetical protein
MPHAAAVEPEEAGLSEGVVAEEAVAVQLQRPAKHLLHPLGQLQNKDVFVH